MRVGLNWYYTGVLVDLFNREIIGYSAGKNKDAELVSRAFSRVDISLETVQIFHTDRGNEFKTDFWMKRWKPFIICERPDV